MSAQKNDAVGSTASFFSNPLVAYGVGALVIYLVLAFAVPDLFGRLKKGFSDGVDSLLDDLASIFGGPPSSQELAKRSRADEVKGLLSAQRGDRSLSDLVDEPGTFLKKLLLG